MISVLASYIAPLTGKGLYFRRYVMVIFPIHTLFLLGYWLIVRRRERFSQEFKFRKDNHQKIYVPLLNFYSFYIVFGTILLVLIAALLTPAYGNFAYFSVTDRLYDEYNFYFYNVLSGLILVLIIAPIFEEFFFRYLILRNFEKINSSIPFVIAGNSILFLIIHFPDNIFEVSFLDSLRNLIFISFEIGVASIFFSILYIKTRRLIYPIIGHFLWNLFDMIFLNMSLGLSSIKASAEIFFLVEFVVMLLIAVYLLVNKQLFWNEGLKKVLNSLNKEIVVFIVLFFILVFFIQEIFQYLFY